MAKSPLNTVRESLQAYADRGVFRGFSENKPGLFSFVWLLHHQMELSVDPAKHTLKFKQLLPGVAAKSAMYADLKRFIQQRQGVDLPEHRRIDPKRAEIGCSNRGGQVSVSIKVKNNQYDYGVNKLVNLVHELFVYLRDSHPGYLAENFDLPQE